MWVNLTANRVVELNQVRQPSSGGMQKYTHSIFKKYFKLCCEVICTYVLMIKVLPCKQHRSESQGGTTEAERVNFWYSLVIRAS